MMNHEYYPQSFEINSSLMNLFDKSTLYTAFWPAHAFVDTVKQSGYEGLEWHPVKGLVAGQQMNHGLVGNDTKDAIRSLHQSWRSEKSVGEAWHHPKRGLAVVSYLLLSERIASLDTLEHLQDVVGRKLPVVLYPEKPGEPSGTDRKFDETSFQPTPEVMREWKVATPSSLIYAAQRRGYDCLCLDLFHIRERSNSGIDLNPWRETIPWLLPFTREIHVSAGRVDMNAPYVDTMQELKDLLAGKGETDLMNMLRSIASSGWRGRIVTEIPAQALHAIRSETGRRTSMNDLIDDHKKIVDTISAIFV